MARDDFEREIDLHGVTVARALVRLGQDLYMARARGERSVVVITGRGYGSRGGTGVLGPAVRDWLRGEAGRKLGVHSIESIAKGGALRVHLMPVGQDPA
ncbi:MAG: Smr/MutS family protein [Planctomycetota bacterium]